MDRTSPSEMIFPSLGGRSDTPGLPPRCIYSRLPASSPTCRSFIGSGHRSQIMNGPDEGGDVDTSLSGDRYNTAFSPQWPSAEIISTDVDRVGGATNATSKNVSVFCHPSARPSGARRRIHTCIDDRLDNHPRRIHIALFQYSRISSISTLSI